MSTVDASEALDRVFAALADPTRRSLLERLGEGSVTVGDLARPFAMSLPAISRHLKVLERAGLMQRTVEGRVHRCRVRTDPLELVQQWLAARHAHWDHQLDALRDFVESPPDD